MTQELCLHCIYELANNMSAPVISIVFIIQIFCGLKDPGIIILIFDCPIVSYVIIHSPYIQCKHNNLYDQGHNPYQRHQAAHNPCLLLFYWSRLLATISAYTLRTSLRAYGPGHEGVAVLLSGFIICR